MVKKSKKGSKGKKNDSCLVPFHQVLTGSLAAGLAATIANPSSIGGRLLTEADGWTLFRFTSLAFRLIRIGTVTSYQVASFVPGVQDTNPASLAQNAEILCSCVLGGVDTRPTPWVKVTKAELAGQITWYKSIPGASTSSWEEPGTFVIAGSGTDAYLLELRGVVEFKGAIATGNTPEELAHLKALRDLRVARALEAERKKMVTILTQQPTPAAAVFQSGLIPAAALSRSPTGL